MDIMELGSKLLKEQLGENADNADLSGAMNALGGGSGLDIGSVVSGMMANGSLSGMVSSWLGDGDNETMDAGQLGAIFEHEQLAGFAEKLGIDTDSAEQLVSKFLPMLIDKSSSGGSLLDSIGGLDDVMDFAKKLF
jgi:uncharacterized protein YidB (DUF937 family)